MIGFEISAVFCAEVGEQGSPAHVLVGAVGFDVERHRVGHRRCGNAEVYPFDVGGVGGGHREGAFPRQDGKTE